MRPRLCFCLVPQLCWHVSLFWPSGSVKCGQVHLPTVSRARRGTAVGRKISFTEKNTRVMYSHGHGFRRRRFASTSWHVIDCELYPCCTLSPSVRIRLREAFGTLIRVIECLETLGQYRAHRRSLINEHLIQRLVLKTPGSWAQSSPLAVFINKVLLSHSHTHLFTYYLWLILQCKWS